MSDLVGNPEDRFSRIAALFILRNSLDTEHPTFIHTGNNISIEPELFILPITLI